MSRGLNMSSVLCFRKFVSERLIAAAEEILGVFEQTVQVYEEEIERQRRLLETKLPEKDVSQSSSCNEEVLLGQQRLCDCNQKRNSTLSQGESEFSVDAEELCSSRDREQLVLKQETDLLRLAHEGSDYTEDQIVLMDPHQIQNAAQRQLQTHLAATQVKSESYTGGSGVSALNSDHQLTHNSHIANDRDLEGGHQENASSHQTPENKHFKCMLCSEEFNDFLKFKFHSRTHTGDKRFKCGTCGKGFKCQSNHISHMRTHSGERPHNCVTCGKTFTRRADLRRHNRTHTGEKPYSCIFCGNKFSHHSSLTNHVRVHTGEKPYKCIWCGKRFAINTTLKIHTRVHTGEKPYTCNLCGRNFAHNTGLRLHRRTHAGENQQS
ncbi:zinc finger protein 502 [Pleuronectes platessa]|uniref:zinc finger protein 502 n=1 Tax=Pleuronectes platessa TaxID=8262 RepID=UPI00232A53B6|nr:zinc finger protein 502 [Pleuronectes platessa]